MILSKSFPYLAYFFTLKKSLYFFKILPSSFNLIFDSIITLLLNPEFHPTQAEVFFFFNLLITFQFNIKFHLIHTPNKGQLEKKKKEEERDSRPMCLLYCIVIISMT
jgi:hypothetical protein